jgi:hypothetical protein
VSAFQSASASSCRGQRGWLSQHFKLRDLGPTTQLLGIKIDRDRSKRSINISQHQCCLDILEQFGMSDCMPISTPMQPNSRLSHSQCLQTPEEVEFVKGIPHLAAVGALMYLATSTRPDIAYTVGCLARFNSNLGIIHWHAVKHLLLHHLQDPQDGACAVTLQPRMQPAAHSCQET